MVISGMAGKMKYKIISNLKVFFHHFGFTIERIPNAESLFHDLKDAPKSVQISELKRISRHLKITNNHKLYNEILNMYVPDWDNNFISSQFVGKGIGGFNFDVYRKVGYQGNYYFEKIYFSNSYDFLKMEWFYQHIYPLLEDRLKAPKLHKVLKGDLITIVYFEYIDLVPLPKHEWRTTFFDLSRHMFKLSEHTEELCSKAPNFIKKYALHSEYSKNIKISRRIIKALSDGKLSSKMIEKVINSGPLVLTHADMYDANVFSGGYFIDWDSFGFFPRGFETAIIMSFIREVKTFADFKNVIHMEYEGIIGTEHWDNFEISCLYFYLVLTAPYTKDLSEITLQNDIVNRIQKLYETNIGNCNRLA